VDTYCQEIPERRLAEGVDLKFIEEDPELRSTIQLIRLRPGKSTPLFTIPGATHMFVLEGQVDITPAGGTPSTLKQNWYAFVPNGFAISLSNPKPYRGPGRCSDQAAGGRRLRGAGGAERLRFRVRHHVGCGRFEASFRIEISRRFLRRLRIIGNDASCLSINFVAPPLGIEPAAC